MSRTYAYVRGLTAALVGTIAVLAAVPAYANVFVPNLSFIASSKNTPGTLQTTIFLDTPAEQVVTTTWGGLGLTVNEFSISGGVEWLTRAGTSTLAPSGPIPPPTGT